MYSSVKGRYSDKIRPWERIIPLDREPVSFGLSDIEPGMTVEFVYRPWLTNAEREYSCEVVSVGKNSFVAKILRECPITIGWSSRKKERERRFRLRKTKMYGITKPEEAAQSVDGVPSGYTDEHGMQLAAPQVEPGNGASAGYRDEHGIIR
jgi:hypothetical protein